MTLFRHAVPLFTLGIAIGWLLQPSRIPDLTLTALSGEKIHLAKAGGGPMLISFWASSCPACLEEIPLLTRLHRKYGPQGLRLIAVTMPYDPPNRTLAFLRRRPLPFPVALDHSGKISETFGIRLIPTLVLVADGRMVWRHTGIPDPAALQALIETVVPAGEKH